MKGEISKLNLLLGIVLIFVISAFLFFPGSAVTSSGGNFTVTPDNVSLNWTGDSINMTSNNDSVILLIKNESTGIQPQYFDGNKYTAGSEYPGYQSSQHNICFTNGMAFVVQNSSGTYTNVTETLDSGNSTIYNLTSYQFCPPGYYSGKFNVTQNGTNDWANVSAAVNIPVNPDNSFYEPNSTAYLKGTLAANTNLIHKYYFNTSLADNITGMTINLSGYTQDVDLYLFDSSGNLLARSIENGSSMEGVYKDLPGTPDMWEIWIWGNVTSDQNYLANMYFTTLNVTNMSDPNQKISSMDFGNIDPENNESGEINITVSNVDTKVWTGVEEQSEIYRVETWNSKNVTGDYYFLVPYFAEKVKVKIEWTGGTRWFISLNDSNKTFIGNSSEKFETGNKTGSIQEEHVVYSGTINTGNDGLWKATVGNLTAISDDKYNLTVYVWHDQSGLLSSDYPTGGFAFQSAGSANSSKNVSLKITLPSPTISNGTYEGFIEYYKPSKWNLRIPVSFSVEAGNLLVNKTFESATVTRYDNMGFNRLGVGVLQITLPVNNTGGKDVYFTGSTSDNALKKGSYYMNTSVGWPSIPIQAGSSDTIEINISINTSNTGDSSGVYTGWVKLVTANSTNASSSSYPFENLTINLKVNLENNLAVNLTEISPTLIKNPSNNTNITLNITVKLANGTIVSANEKINQSNFYNVYLQEGNTSYLTSTTLQNLTHSGGNPFTVVCPTGETYCRLNGTLLSGKPGGLYYAYASARLNTSVFGGTGILITGTNRSFMQTAVNDTGLKISEAENIDILEGQEKIYVIKINNYGYKNAVNVEVRFDKGDCPLDVSRKSTNTTCSGKTGGTTSADWEFDINKYTNCMLAWELDAGSVNQDTDCDADIKFMTSHTNYGDEDVDVDVDDNATANGGEDGDAAPIFGCTSNSSCATDEYCKNGVCITLSCSSGWYASGHECKEYEKELSITDYDSKVYMLQGGSNSTKVTVKNTGDYELKAKLKVISDLEGLTEDVNPSSYTLKPAKSGVFEIDFSVSNTTEVGYHKITLEAYASVFSDVYTTKNITLAVKPLEKTKAEINQTYDDLKVLFDSIVSIFNQIPPSSEPNYTLANRTYNRLLSMLKDAEEKLKAGNYLDAYSVMKDANSSLTSFEQEVDRLVFEGGQIIIGDTLTWVAILVVIVVIGGFLVYLLLPPKRGYHPTLGFVPKEKVSITDRLKKLFSHVKKIKDIGRGQRTLEAFERPMPVPKEKPLPVLPEKPPEKKTYMEGYERPEEGRYSFKKKGKELKKKLFGK